jgi:hypothetical protein
MTVLLSEEEREFQHALRRFFADTVSSEYLRARIDSSDPFEKSVSDGVGELGLAEYFAEATAVESGGHSRELVITAFEAGRALVPQPVSEILFAGPCVISELLAAGEHLPFAADDLEKIKSGEQRVAPVLASAGGGLTWADGAVSGELGFVPAGCDHTLVLLAGEVPKVFFVLHTAQRRESPQGSLDLSVKRSTVQLSSAAIHEVSTPLAERIFSLYSLVLCAQSAGVCQRVRDMTTEYVSVRKQFDVPIGGFQAVQHGLADMHAHAQALRAVTFFAGWSAEESKDQLALATRSAASYAVKKSPWIVEKAIQLHGGIGFTWEHDLHFFLRRARLLSWFLETTMEFGSLHQIAANQQ